MLKKLIGAGYFSLDDFVERMRNDGYITEIDSPKRTAIVSSLMEKLGADQGEFDELFAYFYPDECNDISLDCVASNEGSATEGGFQYALYNTNVISRDEVMKILFFENKKYNCWP